MDKKAQIMNAAIKVFARDGFHGARVEDIASEAGVGKGTVYQYFASKEDLFQEMFKSSVQMYLDNLKRELCEGSSARDKLERAVGLNLSFTQRGRDVARVVMENPGGISIELKRWLFQVRGEVLALVAEVIREGIRNGEFREVDPVAAARMFLGANHALGAAVLFGESELPPEPTRAAFMDMFLNGIGKPRNGGQRHACERQTPAP